MRSERERTCLGIAEFYTVYSVRVSCRRVWVFGRVYGYRSAVSCASCAFCNSNNNSKILAIGGRCRERLRPRVAGEGAVPPVLLPPLPVVSRMLREEK